MKKLILLFASLGFLTFKNQAQTVTDVDGNTYNTVTIGAQTWMKENLRTSKYNDYTSIEKVTDNSVWSSTGNGAYCWYNNDSASYENDYGKLYNWYAANAPKLCPNGWHTSTSDEWIILADFLGGYSGATTGGKMKQVGTVHWLTPNTGATNSSGFTGLPGGFRRSDGSFGWLDTAGTWWTTTTVSCNAWAWRLNYDASTISTYGIPLNSGYSLRCIKNPSTQINEFNNQKELKIFPNPAIEKISIENPNPTTKAFTLSITNIQGQLLFSEKVVIDKTHTLDLSKYPNGIYFFTLQNEKENYVSKVVVQR